MKRFSKYRIDIDTPELQNLFLPNRLAVAIVEKLKIKKLLYYSYTQYDALGYF